MSLVLGGDEAREHSVGVVGESGVSPRRAADSYHVGYPVTMSEKLDRARRGLPVYWPTDPKDIDQRPYLAFASKRPPNSQ